MALTELRMLEEAHLDFIADTVTLTWRERIFKDGVERDRLRVADTKVYTRATKEQLTTDLALGRVTDIENKPVLVESESELELGKPSVINTEERLTTLDLPTPSKYITLMGW